MLMRIVAVLIGYAFGNFQTSVFVGRKQGINIREHGSGNAGTTNALRVMGSKAGIITFIGDLGKMMLAYLVVWLIFGQGHPEYTLLLKLYTGLGVVLGHDFPVILGFRGGKGIAVTAGMLILLGWRTTVVGVILFLGTLALTHLVSLGSLLLVTLDSGFALFLASKGIIDKGAMSLTEMAVILGVIWLLDVALHLPNIKRLLTGTENKIFLSAYAKKRNDKHMEKKAEHREARDAEKEQKP